MKIPAIESWNLRKAVDSAGFECGLILDLLLQLHPSGASAKALMYHYAGSDYSRDPLPTFVKFIHLYRRVNVLIAPLGYTISRTGGLPTDKYRLDKIE